ncbi:MAG: response regulator, partial [Gammaproteobacteria bacterium]
VESLASPDDRTRGTPEEALRNARERGRTPLEQTFRRKDGSTFQGQSILSALQDDPRKGFVQTIRDQSEVQQAQAVYAHLADREQSLTRELEHSRRSRDEVFEALADALERPLNLIQVNADMLMKLPDTRDIPVVGKISESVSKAVANQMTIISDLRDLSLARSGKLNLQMQAASLRELVDTVVRSFKTKAEARSLTLTFQKGDDPLLALCDPARVLRIIRHLIENAILSADQGAISVHLDRDGDFARLSVTDPFHGMPPKSLPGVFRTVDQPGTSPAPNNGRLGLGLALVPSLVEAHGGRILAESDAVTRRTSVWLRLIQSLSSASTPRMAQRNPLDGLRLVLVDDSVDLLTSFGALLGMEGATVETFDNAKAALTRLCEGNVDLLISDLGMPGMDGYQLIREVRTHPQLASLPAIALTGYGRTRDPAHAVKSGFNAHTTKPATVEELQNIVALLKPT